MASVPLVQAGAGQAGSSLLGIIRQSGSASHAYVESEALRSAPQAARNLADAIHLLCALHGRHPGVVELVAARTVEPPVRRWLGQASDAFAGERAYLARLAVAAGPIPATPGQGSESALAMQRNAIMTLAQSERRGCAVGAALAVAADWAVIRTVLDSAAQRFGLATPRPWGHSLDGLAELADEVGSAPAVRRALLFGAEQVALQHRGLWDLLQARAEARHG